MGEAILTAKETAQALRLGLSTVYHLFNSGRLRGYRIGRRLFIYESGLEEAKSHNQVVPKELPPEQPKRKRVVPIQTPTHLRYVPTPRG